MANGTMWNQTQTISPIHYCIEKCIVYSEVHIKKLLSEI